MTELLGVLKEHLPAVERDLIVSGFHLYDIGTPKLSWAELHSFVMAAPPGSAVYAAQNEKAQEQIAAITNQPMPQHGAPTRGQQQTRQLQANPQSHPQQRPPPLQNMRGRNMADVFHPNGDPNKQISRPLAKAEVLPLDQFRARMEARDAEYAARQKPKEAGNADS